MLEQSKGLPVQGIRATRACCKYRKKQHYLHLYSTTISEAYQVLCKPLRADQIGYITSSYFDHTEH